MKLVLNHQKTKQDKFYSDKEKERLYKHLEKLKLLGDEQYDLEDQCKI